MVTDLKRKVKGLKRKRFIYMLVASIYATVGMFSWYYQDESYGFLDKYLMPIFCLLFLVISLAYNAFINECEQAIRDYEEITKNRKL